MTKQVTREKSERGYFAAKSVVSKKGATMRVIKLELTPSASEQLKADSRGITAGIKQSVYQEAVAAD